jgi:hypothetical protein
LLGGCRTELAFETPVKYQTALLFRTNTGHTIAIFRQINKGVLHVNHDALEFPDGEIVLLTRLCEGQKATVLTLPPQAKTANKEEAQQRIAHARNKSSGRSLSGCLLPAEHGRLSNAGN